MPVYDGTLAGAGNVEPLSNLNASAKSHSCDSGFVHAYNFSDSVVVYYAYETFSSVGAAKDFLEPGVGDVLSLQGNDTIYFWAESDVDPHVLVADAEG